MLTILSSSVFSEGWDCDMQPSCVWCHEMIQKKRKENKRKEREREREKIGVRKSEEIKNKVK